MLVRKRFSVSNPGQVTGYSVALPGDTTKDSGPVWYGGGKLAADLSWPKLRQRWTPHRAAPGRPHLNLTAEERNAIWQHAARRCRRHSADPQAGLDRPGGRRRRRLGHLRHPARGRRRARQPHPAPGRRHLRPRRTPTLRPYSATVSGWEPAPPGRPAPVRIRLPDQRPMHNPDRPHHETGRARRSRRRTPRHPAARRPGRRRSARRRAPLRRHPSGSCPAVPRSPRR